MPWGEKAELEAFIGRTGLLSMSVFAQGQTRRKEYLYVPIVIVDVKRAFGSLRYQVRPNDSRPNLGCVWADSARVTLDGGKK
jgi:hypothetical protein